MLKLEGVSASYGAIHALREVSLSVQVGQFVAIVGPNGAGKTTLFKTISGQVVPDAGTIHFEGQDLLAMPARDRAHLGIAHVPEGRQVFGNLTVLENLEMGATPAKGRAEWVRGLRQLRRSTLAGKLIGAPDTNRTCDPPLRRGMLYPLSYGGAGMQ